MNEGHSEVGVARLGDIALAINQMAQNILALMGEITIESSAYADLPTPALGMIRSISDSDTAVWGDTIAGGGANVVLAWYNGSDWTVIGA